MNDEELLAVLKSADVDDAPCNATPELADRVWQLAGQRRRRRRAAMGTAVSAGLLAAVWWVFPADHRHPSAPPVDHVVPQVASSADPPPIPKAALTEEDLSRIKFELAQLDLEIERRAMRVTATQSVIAEESRPLSVTVLTESAPSVSDQLEVTARIRVCQADYLARELGQHLAAVDLYRGVVEQFPQSPSAEVARDRLARLEMN